MRGLNYRFSVLAVTAMLVGVGACGGSDSNSGANAPPQSSTGVVSAGVITGFGSVYVNGIRYDTSSAAVSMDDEAAVESALKVGQYVEVKGHSHGADHHADVIRYHDIIEGPITSIDLGASSFVAMGQTVLVTSQTSLGDDIVPASIEGLAVGDVVEVSGFVTTLGRIEATRLDIEPHGGPYDVTGYVSNPVPAASRFNINALVVDYSRATLEDFKTGQPVQGDLVLVKGFSFNADGSFVATRVESRSDDRLEAEAGDELEVEGAITDFVSATAFKVAGRAVTTTPNTLYERGTVANLGNDVLVEVEGTANAGGVLVALKIRFEQVSTIRIVAQIGELLAADRSMKLLGLVVATDEATRFQDRSVLKLRHLNFGDLAVNDWVEVRGYQNPRGSNAVAATRVVRTDREDGVRLRGPFLDPMRPGFRILSVMVATTAVTRFELEEDIHLTQDAFFTGAVDEVVEAWGSWNGTVLNAEHVEIKVNDD
jgi:hypothetical protein